MKNIKDYTKKELYITLIDALNNIEDFYDTIKDRGNKNYGCNFPIEDIYSKKLSIVSSHLRVYWRKRELQNEKIDDLKKVIVNFCDKYPKQGIKLKKIVYETFRYAPSEYDEAEEVENEKKEAEIKLLLEKFKSAWLDKII